MRALLLIVISLMPNVGLAQDEKISIEISGIDAERGGNLIVLVFGDDGFPVKHEKALLTQAAKVSGDRMGFAFNVPAPTHVQLAFKVLHDQDANNKVTKNWTGYIPKENPGFSAGVTILRGVPAFQKAKMTFAVNQLIQISMRYPGRFGV